MSHENSLNTKQSSWTLGDVMMSDSAGHFGLGRDVDVDNFMHSLDDQSENILNEETVNKLTEILTPEQRMLLEEEVAGSLIKDVPDTPGLNLETVQPCCQVTGHAQSRTSAELRPSTCEQGDCGFISNISSGTKRTMQHEDRDVNSDAFPKSGAIQEGLQKIKQQLSKGGKLVAPEADPGPAVVTQFIGDHENISFGADLDDISKCSMDPQEQNVEKSKEMDPPVRRSGRKTIRLFEIVPPKKHRKKEGESEDSVGVDSSKVSEKDKDGQIKRGEQKRSSTDKMDSSPPRKSLRRPKEDGIDEQIDDKWEKATGKGSKSTPKSEETKKSGPGRKPRIKSVQDDKEEKKSVGRKSTEKPKKEGKSDGEKEKSKAEEKNQLKRSRGRPPRKQAGTGDKKERKKTVKGKRGRKKKDHKSENDEKRSDGEDSETSDSEPDDGELSDDGSEFDPDDDPDRPWCICRKPHGNRFMICCDICEDWYHGDCVGVTQADGKELEKKSEEWMCPKCKKKLLVLAKEVKEKERQERIKMREKTEGSEKTDENSTVEMRKKLLKALEKELVSSKASKTFENDDVSESEEEEGEEEEVEESKMEDGFPAFDDMKEKMKRRIKKKMTKEEREAKEAKQREKELEWKRQLKEMKARAQKAQQIAKRKDSIESQMTFEKIGPQKLVKPKEEHVTIKQESSEKKPDTVKREIKVRFVDNLPERRKSDSIVKDVDRKRPVSAGRRASSDDPKEKIAKTEDPGKKVRITPTPKTVKPVAPPKFCIVCNKVAMKNAVYCSKECIASYTKESLRLITEDKLKRLGLKSSEVKSPVSKDPSKGTAAGFATPKADDNDMDERITVVERSTKKVIAGVMAPTRANIFQWVEEHPTFEVFRPTTTSNTTAKEKKDLTEVVRNNVKKSLKETILTRCRDVEMEVDVDEIGKICSTIEDEIVKMYGDTGQKYKTKYRSLIFNLKDSKNRSLFKQVVQGDLTPTKLVHMTPEQLASAELAKWREREAKHNIELIKMREEEEAYAFKHALKKTHKGEVEVEQEGKEDMKNLQIHIENPEEHKEQQSEEGATPVPFEDTTEQHTSHLFDLNCKICTGKQQPAGEKQPILPHVSTSVIQAIPESSMPSPTGSPEEMDLKQSSPDVIESMDRSPIHIPLPSKEKDDPVWSGNVMMPSVAKFSANAYRISGPCDHLSKLVPDTAHICGRITHEQVWDYLYQLKSTTHKTIEVLRFEMAAEDEKKEYVALYTYFYTRKRIGVIGNCYSGVKDMYIVPIASHDPIPPELKPFDGPGMPDPRPHMLIGIIVRTKPVVPSKRPKTSHHETTEHSHKPKKKHKHKKDEKKKYEDIVFGKQRAGINLEDTPSESGSSYTPTYTPDVISPPSHAPAPTAAAPKNDENLLLEEKLAEQKRELLKLQAEIRAQISENKALGIQSPPQTLLETSTIGAPSSMPSESEVSLPTTSFTGVSSAVSSNLSSTSLTSVSEYTDGSSSVAASSVGVHGAPSFQPGQDRSVLVPGYIPSVKVSPVGETAHGKPTVEPSGAHYRPDPKGDSATMPSTFHTSSVPSVAPITSVATTLPSQSVTQQHNTDLDVKIPGLGDDDMSQSVAATEETKKVAEEDEPYDPEDELDIAMEPDTKAEEKGFGKKDSGDKAKAETSTGDEPYDPEDDFVLDLIEDISVPTPLKKIDKPNLPFPLEMPKKPDNKMPELPPIKLPDKVTDRRAAAMVTGNTPADPRSSPMSYGTWAHTPTGTPIIHSPSPKSLTSPSGSSSLLTSPTTQRSADHRQTPQSSLEKADSNSQQGSSKTEVSHAQHDREKSGAHDGTQSTSDYWRPNHGQEQSYSAYNQYPTSGGQVPGGNYHNTYGDNSYNRQWHAGQRAPDWQGYDYNSHHGDGRAWEGGDRGYGNSWRGDYYGNQAYDGYDNSSYHRTQDYSNYENYRRDDRGRSWDGYGDRGYYRNRDRGRGRGNKWR